MNTTNGKTITERFAVALHFAQLYYLVSFGFARIRFGATHVVIS